MPIKRRSRVPRRGRRTAYRKRRPTRRRRLVKRYKKRKNVSRRTRLTQGFPSTTVATLKYVDVVTDISPHVLPATFPAPVTIGDAPGLLAFSCNDPGMPDLGSTVRSDFPTLYAIKGSFPHQPLGYDQYTLLYQNAKVLRSSAKFTLTFGTRGGYSVDPDIAPAAQYDTKGVDDVDAYAGSVPAGPVAGMVGTTTPLTQKFPAGLYVGIIRVNSFNPLALPQTYTEFLERFKAPLKFVPYLRQMGGFKTVTLYGLYGAPSEKALRSMVQQDTLSSNGERQADMLTLKNGDIPYEYSGATYVGRSGCRHRPPQAQFAWKVVVYYPDDTGVYVLPNSSASLGFIDAVSMRATVNIRYRVRFTKLRQLKQSFLTSTPGINEQPVGGGVPTAGGGSAAATSTAGILDQLALENPETQKALGPDIHQEVPQKP